MICEQKAGSNSSRPFSFCLLFCAIKQK